MGRYEFRKSKKVQLKKIPGNLKFLKVPKILEGFIIFRKLPKVFIRSHKVQKYFTKF
jgi:hypothetical protein